MHMRNAMRLTCPRSSRLLAAACLLATLTFACLAWGDQAGSARIRADGSHTSRQQLVDLEAAYIRAFNSRDAGMLERLLTEDYLITGIDGSTIGRAEFVDHITHLPA